MALGTGGLIGLSSTSATAQQTSLSDINIIGPKEGFSPQIGTLVSMMNWMRKTILWPVRGLKIKDLDHLHDENANSIGAILLHLAATERFYQLNSFEGLTWGDWPEVDDLEWSVASGLGDEARKKIKGNNIDFYIDKLTTVREKTLEEFAKRDDEWLLKVDPDWLWNDPTNNYCKWFHVCEHESNHNGQVKFLISRLP